MVSKGDCLTTDILSSLIPPLLSLFLHLLLCFSPSCRCTLISWLSPGFPWFCWHLPSRLYGNWRKMVTSLSWFSMKAPGSKTGLSGSPDGKSDWNGHALGLPSESHHSGITRALCPCSTFEGIYYCMAWGYLYCLAFTLDARKEAFYGLWWEKRDGFCQYY